MVPIRGEWVENVWFRPRLPCATGHLLIPGGEGSRLPLPPDIAGPTDRPIGRPPAAAAATTAVAVAVFPAFPAWWCRPQKIPLFLVGFKESEQYSLVSVPGRKHSVAVGTFTRSRVSVCGPPSKPFRRTAVNSWILRGKR